MKLWYSAASPFVRKVMVTIHELGMADAVEIVAVTTNVVNSDAALRQRNPLGKIPALELDDGRVVFDSPVICAHLVAIGNGALRPASAEDRLAAMTLEALGDGIMDAAVSTRYEQALRPEQYRWPDWIDGQMLKVASALDALDRTWLPYLRGPVTVGTIAAACALFYLDFRFAGMSWRDGRGKLAQWADAFAERPSMQATVPAA